MALLFTAVAITNLACGFYLGKFHERIEWNKLIRSGRLPKPTPR